MDLLVLNKQKKIKINPLQVQRIIKKILKQLGITQASLSFLFVTHQKIRALNHQYLNRNYATDVLAFDALDEGGLSKSKSRKKVKALCADIIISTDAVVKNSKEFKSTTNKELVLYLIHGILHLCGYDDHSLKDINRMQKRENELLMQVFK